MAESKQAFHNSDTGFHALAARGLEFVKTRVRTPWKFVTCRTYKVYICRNQCQEKNPISEEKRRPSRREREGALTMRRRGRGEVHEK